MTGSAYYFFLAVLLTSLAITGLERRWQNEQLTTVLNHIRLAIAAAGVWGFGFLAGAYASSAAAKAAWGHPVHQMSFANWAANFHGAWLGTFLLDNSVWPDILFGAIGIILVTFGRSWYLGSGKKRAAKADTRG